MDNLEKLLEQKKQIEERIKLLKNKKQAEERKKDTRSKIILGAFVKSKPELFQQIAGSEDFKKYVVREHDRALFDLEPTDSPKR